MGHTGTITRVDRKKGCCMVKSANDLSDKDHCEVFTVDAPAEHLRPDLIYLKDEIPGKVHTINFVKLKDGQDEKIYVLKRLSFYSRAQNVPDEVKIFAHLQKHDDFVKMRYWWYGNENQTEVCILQESFESTFETYLQEFRKLKYKTQHQRTRLTRILVKFAGDLAAMHAENMSHLDVKSANFCLN